MSWLMRYTFVSHWGRQFRTAYDRLNQLRIMFGSHVPCFFACSATLDGPTLKQIKDRVSFPSNVKVQRTSIDRPELVYRLGWIPRDSRSKFVALRFLFTENKRPYVPPLTNPRLNTFGTVVAVPESESANGDRIFIIELSAYSHRGPEGSVFLSFHLACVLPATPRWTKTPMPHVRRPVFVFGEVVGVYDFNNTHCLAIILEQIQFLQTSSPLQRPIPGRKRLWVWWHGYI